jgi:hypothetical protein
VIHQVSSLLTQAAALQVVQQPTNLIAKLIVGGAPGAPGTKHLPGMGDELRSKKEDRGVLLALSARLLGPAFCNGLQGVGKVRGNSHRKS